MQRRRIYFAGDRAKVAVVIGSGGESANLRPVRRGSCAGTIRQARRSSWNWELQRFWRLLGISILVLGAVRRETL
jgi:hypothetical protein